MRLRNMTAVEPSNTRWSQLMPRYPMWWIVIESVPSGISTTTGRFLIVSVDRIAAFGTLMIGTDRCDPNGPGLVTVNVEPREIVRPEVSRTRSSSRHCGPSEQRP